VKIVTIVEELSAFRAGFPGCRVVAFADLSTGMVLAADAAEKTTQEKLDALCEAGNTCLTGTRARVVSRAFAKGTRCFPLQAWQVDQNTVRCFVRMPDPAVEALCFVADATIALDALCREARPLLQRLVTEG
jgi:hypothetical protein